MKSSVLSTLLPEIVTAADPPVMKRLKAFAAVGAVVLPQEKILTFAIELEKPPVPVYDQPPIVSILNTRVEGVVCVRTIK